MAKTRIMVVDDSVVARRMISEILSEHDDIAVVGTAANGKIALAKIPILAPDVITLDVDMPEMNGMEMLVHLRERHPDIKVVMVSSLTSKGAQTTVDALFLGASDYVTKTARVDSPEQAKRLLQDQLLPKIRELMLKAAAPPPVILPPERTLGSQVPLVRAAPAPSRRVEPRLVAIGASTGGPNALVTVLQAIPKGFPLPIVIVQHMPEDFTRYLAKRLDDKCSLRVVEAADGDRLEPGLTMIAPGNHHMELAAAGTDLVVRLHDGPLVNSCRPSVDVLFESVAAVLGPATLAVVLTGMGQDGFAGSRSLRRAGARIVVQDQESSVVWGMPGYIAQAGLADLILPVGEIGTEISLAVKRRP